MYLIYVLAPFVFLAAIPVAYRWWKILFRLHISSNAFMHQIDRLLRADNLERARKLCAACPTQPLAWVVDSVLELSEEGMRGEALRNAVLVRHGTPRELVGRGVVQALGLPFAVLAIPAAFVLPCTAFPPLPTIMGIVGGATIVLFLWSAILARQVQMGIKGGLDQTVALVDAMS